MPALGPEAAEVTSAGEPELGTCPGAPCADGRLNHYGVCVEKLFIDDDLVESENRRVVLDDGGVNVDGEIRVIGLGTLLGLVVKMYIGEDGPNREPRNQICRTGPVLLEGTGISES